MDTFAILTKVFTDLTSNQFLIIDVWIFVLLLVFLAFLFVLIRKVTSFKYKYSGKLLSNAERFFFLVLKQSLSEDDYEIFVKVRIADIELDDSSHNRSKTRARDIFVEKACKTAGLKLIRFPCRSNYHLESIRDKIINSLNLPV